MLSLLPPNISLCMLRKCDGATVDTVERVSKTDSKFVQSHRHVLPKHRAFLSVQLLDDTTAEFAFYRSERLRMCSEGPGQRNQVESRTLRWVTFNYPLVKPHAFSIPTFQDEKLPAPTTHTMFRRVQVEGLLVCGKRRQLVTLSNPLMRWLIRAVDAWGNSLTYVSLKYCTFNDTAQWSQFQQSINKATYRELSILKVEGCHFGMRSMVQHLYLSSVVCRVRVFQELYSEFQKDDLNDKSIRANLLLRLLTNDSFCDIADMGTLAVSSRELLEFAEAWCMLETPPVFKRLSFPKSDDTLKPALARSRFVSESSEEATTFLNLYHPALSLSVYFDSPICLRLHVRNSDQRQES